MKWAAFRFLLLLFFFSFFFTNLFFVSVLVNDFIQHLGRALSPFKFYLLVSFRGNFLFINTIILIHKIRDVTDLPHLD
jgi:hypothetical protein